MCEAGAMQTAVQMTPHVADTCVNLCCCAGCATAWSGQSTVLRVFAQKTCLRYPRHFVVSDSGGSDFNISQQDLICAVSLCRCRCVGMRVFSCACAIACGCVGVWVHGCMGLWAPLCVCALNSGLHILRSLSAMFEKIALLASINILCSLVGCVLVAACLAP